jgi:RNA polymerase sigma factor (sigma-70 family)
MNGDNTTAALRRLARRMAAETIGDWTDRRLVEHFLTGRNEVVFEILVRRHGPMVYRVCWRVLQQAEDAEDAFQATFLVLARNLAAVRDRDSLASWLHGVAHRIALKARSLGATRKRHEALTPIAATVPPDDLTWKELRAVLDAELARLPEKWRLPLVLCYLEGRTQDEAAAELGYSGNTLRRRLEAARAALGRRLSRRGFGAAALAAVLVADCTSRGTASPATTSATIETMTRLATGRTPTSAVPPKVAALAEGVNAMSLNKFKAAAAVLLVVGALGTLGAAFQPLQARVEPPPAGTRAEPPQDAKPTPAPDVKPKTDMEKLQGFWKVIETRVDGETYPTPEGVDGRLVIEGDDFGLGFSSKSTSGPSSGSVLSATFKLNTTTSPRNIDLFTSKDQAHLLSLGIYKLDGDDLMICLPHSVKHRERRPTEFTAEKGSDRQLYKLRRVEAKPKTDTEKLQGTWEVLETRVNGETYPTHEVTDHRLVIEGDKFRLTSMPKEPPKLGLYGGMIFIATFKLNTTKSPRNIDLEMSKDPEAHEVCLGIYKLDGDDLVICLPYLKPCERRPTEFKAEKGSDQQLYKLRRAKPKKK